jgi:hypothetical protein
MQLRVLANLLLLLLTVAASAEAAPPVELELATEQGVQITAPRQWLQLLTGIGIENVRIRGARANDKPLAENRGDAQHPRYHVVGILTANDRLRLPGGEFADSDRQRLADYFTRLAADGAESMTAERGRFGLTKAEYTAAHADLAQPLGFATQGQSLRAVLDRAQGKFSLPLVPDAAANRIIEAAAPVKDDVSGLSAGTALAIVLRSTGLALRPDKSVGEPLALRIVPAGSVEDVWPIGWEAKASPGETAPALMEFLNVEIEGYTLQEAIDAIAPRLKLPIFWDHAALAAHKIDPATIQVHVPRTRTFYKRILDRVLAQARLNAQLRVDDAGTAFLWISK